MKPNGATQRTFRDPTPALPFRRIRNRRKERRPAGQEGKTSVKFLFRDVAEGQGQREIKLAPMVRLGGQIDPPVSLTNVRWGGLLGLIAMGLVANLWFGVMMSIIYQLIGWDPQCWGEWTSRSFVIGLYGVHLFGIAGSYLARGKRSWGVIAITAFWIGLLGWIPIGIVLSWIL